METVTALIAKYGVAAIFLGCLTEGDSVALAGGFFAHQGVIPVAAALAAAVAGAFLGDGLLYLAGRRFSESNWVRKLRNRAGFGHALQLAARRPRAFVFGKRFVFGMRLIGGVAAGLVKVDLRLFLLWSLVSTVVWAGLFIGVGYFFGVGAEAVLGEALREHERLLVGLGLVLVLLLAGFAIARRVRRREARIRAEANVPRDGGSAE